MAVILGAEALEGAVGMGEAIDLLERVLAHEAGGRTRASPKFHFEFGTGAMRMLVAADHEAGLAAMKAYHTIRGAGTRYLVALYRLADGELLALLDGRLITDLRTGAASGVLARRIGVARPVTVGVIGSGRQARAQLAALAAVYAVERAAVWSPTASHREAFAREMSARLGIAVEAVESVQAAVCGRAVVAAASAARAAEPVLRGEWLDSCRLLCAVGNTRREFAELDERCFERARLVVLDTLHALEEAGELVRAAACGALAPEKRTTLAEVVAGVRAVPPAGLVVFKSVGSALQDLALAARCYERLGARPGLPAAPDLARAPGRA